MSWIAVLWVAAATLQALDWPRAGAQPIDRFHPERDSTPEAHAGGELVVAVPALPPSLNAMIESSGVARQILYETHESLLRRNWETWELEPALARSWRQERDGEKLVFTFELRDGVRWHDGQPFDARDVLFSYECFRNPHVRCDRKRGVFEKIERAEFVEPNSVRFVFAEPYFLAASTFDETFTILPSHVYDLSDADNPAHKEDASAEEQGRFVNEHGANRAWIGLGPYRVTNWSADRIEATRFEGYFDESNGGFVDALRWRALSDNQAALTALLEGEIDFFDRLSVEDYFSDRTRGEPFTKRCYTGLIQTPALSVTAWNLARPELTDARVRTALALASNWDAIVDNVYRGLATRVTGEQPGFAPQYDRALAPLPFDRARAEALLAQAGWIDRDGDGFVDKDGVALEIEYLHSTGASVTLQIAQALQSDWAAVGVKLELVARDSAGFADALRRRDFDAAAMTLATPFESDPEALWHSKNASAASANRWGLRDERVDALIEAIQHELDAAKRAELFHQLQARIYELQPCLFGVWAARRFALSRRVRGVQLFGLDPGYSLRRWWIEARE